MKIELPEGDYAEIKTNGSMVVLWLTDGTRVDILYDEIRIAKPGTSRHTDGEVVWNCGP